MNQEICAVDSVSQRLFNRFPTTQITNQSQKYLMKEQGFNQMIKSLDRGHLFEE